MATWYHSQWHICSSRELIGKDKGDIPPRHDDGSIIESLFHSIVSMPRTPAIMRPSPQHRELLVEVAIDEW